MKTGPLWRHKGCIALPQVWDRLTVRYNFTSHPALGCLCYFDSHLFLNALMLLKQEQPCLENEAATGWRSWHRHVLSHRQTAQTQLTKAEREGAVPRPSLPPQAGENLGTFQGVARVTAVRHRAAGKVTLVLPLVAKLGDARILAFHQLKTLQKGDAAHQEKKNK